MFLYYVIKTYHKVSEKWIRNVNGLDRNKEENKNVKKGKQNEKFSG